MIVGTAHGAADIGFGPALSPYFAKDDPARQSRGGAFDMADGPLLTEFEPAFDAASFVRFCRDIFWQPDLVSNTFGAAWLARHLGDGFRIHTIRFREHAPVHIDTTFVPIRPGLVLANPERPCLDDTLDLFTRNDWRIVRAASSARSGKAAPARRTSAATARRSPVSQTWIRAHRPLCKSYVHEYYDAFIFGK